MPAPGRRVLLVGTVLRISSDEHMTVVFGPIDKGLRAVVPLSAISRQSKIRRASSE